MSDNTAILAGYTLELMAYSDDGQCDIHIFAKPDSDLDGRVKVYDADNCEWLALNGWMFTFEPIESDNV